MTDLNLTPASHELFAAFVADAGNWSGQPLVGGNVAMTKSRKGNLTDLVKKGLLTIADDGEGNTYVNFTSAGIDYAKLHGIPDADWLAVELGHTTKQAVDAVAAIYENGLEMDPAGGEAFEAPLTAEGPDEAKADIAAEIRATQNALVLASLRRADPATVPTEAASLLAAWAEERGVKVEIVDHMAIVCGFGTGAHSRLKNFSLGHFRRFPQWTPQTGRYVAVTEKFGLVEFLDGKMLREELAGKQVPVLALARVVEEEEGGEG